jgi:hypothetical protein
MSSRLNSDRNLRSAKEHFDLSVLSSIDQFEVSELSRRESRNRETHLPPLSTFRWWARRTGAVNEAILEAAKSVFGSGRLNVLDPFAGGGTIPLVALKAGHRVYAQDLNPWATTGLRRMLDLPSAEKLRRAHQDLYDLASPLLKRAYETNLEDGSKGSLLHTFRVAVGKCEECGSIQRQFPYSLLTLQYRKERLAPEAILACRAGHVFFGTQDSFQRCPTCDLEVDPGALYTPRRITTCSNCGHAERLSVRASHKGWAWEIVLVERGNGKVREFALPTRSEVKQSERGWDFKTDLGKIPLGRETGVLLNHGFKDWSDLYPTRQASVTESLLALAPQVTGDESVLESLSLAVIGTTEFAGHLCRWDRFYLKCNDATAGHRFNFSTFVPELNVWGAGLVGRGTVTRRIRSMERASKWLDSEIPKRASLRFNFSMDSSTIEQPDVQVTMSNMGNCQSFSGLGPAWILGILRVKRSPIRRPE